MNSKAVITTDQDLVKLAQQGSDGAFSSLYKRYFETMFRLALSFVRHTEDAEDVTQEAFIKANRSLKNFRADSKFSTWMYRITANASLDFIKKKKRKAKLKREIKLEIEELVSPQITFPGKELRDAIGNLPEKLRFALEMTCFHGFTHKEVAEMASCAETTISWRIFKAKKELRKAMSR